MANKALEVKKDGDRIIWLVEGDCDYNTTITVHDGTQALVIVDGGVSECVYSGQATINKKSLFGKADGKKWAVYGVNTSTPIELLWGAAALYTDTTLNNASLSLRSYGQVIARIENGKQLFSKLLSDDNKALSQAELVYAVKPMLLSLACDVIGQEANALGDHTKIAASKTSISDKLKQECKKRLENNYGLILVDSIINKIDFPELPKYLDLSNINASEKMKTEIAKQHGDQLEHTARGVNAFSTQPNNQENNEKEGK